MVKSKVLLATSFSLVLSQTLAAPVGTVYTANECDSSISQVSLASGQVNTIALKIAPHNVQVSPDGHWLLAVGMPPHAEHAGSAMSGGSVSVIDTATLKETAKIAVGKAPVQVGFAPDGRQAYVSLSAESKLGLLDTTTQKLTKKVAVGRTPIQMYATQDGRQVYVANQGSSAKPDDRVSVVDPDRGKVVATLTTGKGAHGVAISRDGAYVFVSNIEAGTFSVIDTASGRAP